MLNAEAREALTHLVQRYHSALPKKAKDLQTAYDLSKEAQWSEDAVRHFRVLVHRLAGSAASYGFDALGESARELDQSLIYIAEHPKTDIEGLVPSRFSALQTAIEDALSRPPPGDPAASAQPKQADKSERPAVIVVDDDDELVQVLCRQLMSLGFNAHGFTEPSQAINAAKGLQPAAVMMDLQFADGRDYGFQVAEAMISTLRYKPGVIYISSNDGIEMRKAAVDAGANAFFAKPIQLSALTRLLEQYAYGPADQQPERVAIVDDDPQISEYFSTVLRGSDMETLVLNDSTKVLNPLLEFRPDLILMDIQMPGYDGIDVTSILRQHESLFMVPILFLSSVTDAKLVRSAVRAGGDAMLSKSEEPDTLIHVVRDRVLRYRRVSASLRTDTLTRVLNRTALMERLNFDLQRAQRDSQALSVVVFDVDSFGQFNMDHGRMAGDAVLQEITQTVRERLRSVDSVGRYGGDEIMVIMPATRRASAEAVVRELVDRIGKLAIRTGDQAHAVTASAIIIECRLDRHDSTHFAAHQLLSAVDSMMLSAKREGPSSVLSSVHWLKRDGDSASQAPSVGYVG